MSFLETTFSCGLVLRHKDDTDADEIIRVLLLLQEGHGMTAAGRTIGRSANTVLHWWEQAQAFLPLPDTLCVIEQKKWRKKISREALRKARERGRACYELSRLSADERELSDRQIWHHKITALLARGARWEDLHGYKQLVIRDVNGFIAEEMWVPRNIRARFYRTVRGN